MSNPRSRLAAVTVVLALAVGAFGCAKTQSLLEPQPEALEPIAPGQPGFDVATIDEIIPGITGEEQIRDWFGEPDARAQRQDGTSEWVYNKARLRHEDPREVAQRKREEEKARAEQARQLREETIALVAAGRRQVSRFFDWAGRKLLYPPRRGPTDAPVGAEPPEPEAIAPDAPLLWRDGPTRPEVPPAVEDDTKPVMQFDLAVSFTRDGVVDEFRYQRTAGREFVP